MKKIFTIAFFALIIGVAGSAKAQFTRFNTGDVITATSGSTSQNSTVNTAIAPIMDLAITGATSSSFDFSDIAKLDAGITNGNAVAFMFRSNKPWLITIKADGANFTGGDTDTPMPAGILQYAFAGQTNFKPLTTLATNLGGDQAQARGAGTFSLDYKMNPGYNYGPGNYSLGITYTITNP